MKFFTEIIANIVFFLNFGIGTAFANGDEDHPPGTPHTEAASIDPTMVIGIVIFLVIGGFLLWKFVLRNPNPPSSPSAQPPSNPQTPEKTVAQSVDNEVSSKDK